DYKAIFAKDKYDIGTVKDYEARIDLLVDKFCTKRAYRSLKKGEGKTRRCIDFRILNKIVIPQPQPIPLIHDLIIKASNRKYFTSLDINSGFLSIPLRVEDRKLKLQVINQTIVKKIRCRINESKENKAWTTVARECVDKYNITEHSVTGFTPQYLLDGTNTNLLPEELKQYRSSNDWKKYRKLALQNTIKSHKYNKQLFDKNRKEHEYNTGNLVYVENGNRLNRQKLDELRIGLFEITEKISNTILRIKTRKRNEETGLFHITKLIPE
ncbi:Ribonuclease H-like domain, partial [Cinara cedri]